MTPGRGTRPFAHDEQTPASSLDERPVLTIGWIGLGGMGLPMATNVAQAGFDLIVHDLRSEAVDELVLHGATAASGAADVAAASEIVFASLPGEGASREVAAEVFGSDTTPDIYVETSTLAPTVMKELAASATAADTDFFDAPVSGGVRSRREGTLSVMVGGAEAGFERIEPVLNAFGQDIFHLGDVGAGSVAKITNNLVTLTTMVTAMEAVLLGTSQDIDVEQLRDVIMASTGAGPQVLGVTHHYRSRKYRDVETPMIALRLAAKDLELAVALAADVGVDVRTAKAALSHWHDAIAAGLGEAEVWALIDHLEQNSGPKRGANS